MYYFGDNHCSFVSWTSAQSLCGGTAQKRYLYPSPLFQIGKSSTDMDPANFNWTQFLQNLQQLQLQFTDLFSADVKLTEFFNYNGDMEMWLNRLEKSPQYTRINNNYYF